MNLTDVQFASLKQASDILSTTIADIVIPAPVPPAQPPNPIPPVIVPPSPVKVLKTPYTGLYHSVPLEPQDLPAGKILQRYDNGIGAEAMVWDNKKPVKFDCQPDGSIILTEIDDNGSFCYVTLCHSDHSMDQFGSGTLHFKQDVNYHLSDRRINAWYGTVDSDNDLVNTRVLSEWTNPFKTCGIAIFQLRQYWNVRAYNRNGQCFANKISPDLVADTGFANTPYRASSRWLPSTLGGIYKSFDNGQLDELGKLHPVEFFISKSNIKIVENGFVKVDLPVQLDWDTVHLMPSMGSYHLQNDIQDLINQNNAGNGKEQAWYDLASDWNNIKDVRQFGPQEVEII